VADAYFAISEETTHTGRYLGGEHTVGPWAAHLQHGGPPNALAVRAAERVVRAESGRDDLVALRLAAEFVGPVPVGEIETSARVVRAARSAALAEVTVRGGDRDCLLARVWFVRDTDTSAVASADAPQHVPDVPSGLDYDFGYGASLEWRFVRGRMGVPGPAAAWARPRVPLVDDGAGFSGLARAVLIADSGNGVSAELDWGRWSFLNVDLDVHLARPVAGEWVLLDATTQLGPAGSALARSTLSDVRGVVGAGLQTLVLSAM